MVHLEESLGVIDIFAKDIFQTTPLPHDSMVLCLRQGQLN